LTYALILGMVAAAAEVFGGVLVGLRKEWPRRIQEYLLALSAGFLLALAFFDLIPESIALLGETASLCFLAGFSMLHFFEHTIVGHLHFGEETHREVMISRAASLSALSGLMVHAFFDGLAISAGLRFDPAIGALIFIAVLLHKLPEGLTIASIMMASNGDRREAFLASLCVGAATILGCVILFSLEKVSQTAAGIAFGFSAGTAAYVGASDLIPEINRSGNRVTPLLVFGGMLLFYLSRKFIGSVL
jgi:ZIP family zinc transporter/zinc and cadmium transporter